MKRPLLLMIALAVAGLIVVGIVSPWKGSAHDRTLIGTFEGYGDRTHQTFRFDKDQRYTQRHLQGPIEILYCGRYELKDQTLVVRPDRIESQFGNDKLKESLMKPSTFTVTWKSDNELILASQFVTLYLKRQ